MILLFVLAAALATAVAAAVAAFHLDSLSDVNFIATLIGHAVLADNG